VRFLYLTNAASDASNIWPALSGDGNWIVKATLASAEARHDLADLSRERERAWHWHAALTPLP